MLIGFLSASGLDSSVSPSIRGIIDFVAPVKFGQGLLPSSKIHYIGDEISATFSEDVYCGRPHSFSVTILVETLTPATLSGSDLDIYCKERKIWIEVSSSADLQVCSYWPVSLHFAVRRCDWTQDHHHTGWRA
jgi:hypothetical protein